MSEVEILRWGVGALSALATMIGAGLIGVVVWNAKAIIKSIESLKGEVRNFDRRIIVLESQQRPRVRIRSDRRQSVASATRSD